MSQECTILLLLMLCFLVITPSGLRAPNTKSATELTLQADLHTPTTVGKFQLKTQQGSWDSRLFQSVVT